ncbi:MAG: endonuclease/exonuclease/phosphatase family protein [Candidatus Tritonobacter lacicola]|nr:endonuclease/exonuclease/phosphatase family protein [Candidatus Tritonobacter lacicola]
MRTIIHRLYNLSLAVFSALFLLQTCSLLGQSSAYAFNPSAGDFSKDLDTDVRLLSYNTHMDFISDPSRDDAFNRILSAIGPDVIVFQEINSSLSESSIRSRLDSVLPYGATWEIHFGMSDGRRNVLASRYPLSMTRTDTNPPSSSRGVTIGLVDLPDGAHFKDLYIMGVHLKAMSDPESEAKRQKSCDAIACWMGDARDAPEAQHNYISLGSDTPMIVMGDFNFYSEHPQPEVTLRTGDIQDNGTYGPDVKGDWDITDITDTKPENPYNVDPDTWPSDTEYPYSRIDRFYYTDSASTVANSFILNTLSMNSEQLAAAGLEQNDTHENYSSDHLPVVMDIRIGIGTIRINFQPYTSAAPSGYMKDWGQNYGDEGQSGCDFGWQ